jgi:hypothetical protein
MSFIKTALSTASVAALIAAGAIAATTGIASARVVCNAEGDCWHTDGNYHYGSGVKVEVHPDSWYFHNDWDHDQNRHWRGHAQRRLDHALKNSRPYFGVGRLVGRPIFLDFTSHVDGDHVGARASRPHFFERDSLSTTMADTRLPSTL